MLVIGGARRGIPRDAESSADLVQDVVSLCIAGGTGTIHDLDADCLLLSASRTMHVDVEYVACNCSYKNGRERKKLRKTMEMRLC